MHRWEDNIKMGPVEMVWKGVEWVHLAQDRAQWRAPVNTVMNLRVTQKAENFLAS
jgi:hypothetical protein